MKKPQALSSAHRTLLRDLAVLAGVAVLAFAIGGFTPVFAYAFGWMQRMGPPEVLIGVLASVALAAVVLVVARARWSPADGAAPPPVAPPEAPAPASLPRMSFPTYEEKFARTVRSMPMAIGISRLSDGRFVDVNDHFLELLGYEDRDAVIGRTATELDLWVQPGNRAHVLELLAQNDGTAAARPFIGVMVISEETRREGAGKYTRISPPLLALCAPRCYWFWPSIR